MAAFFSGNLVMLLMSGVMTVWLNVCIGMSNLFYVPLSSDIVLSRYRLISSTVLTWTRLVISLYCFAILMYSTIHSPSKSFIYYTFWSYLVLALYFGSSVLTHVFRLSTVPMFVLYIASMTNAFVVGLAVISTQFSKEAWFSISSFNMHAVNMVLCIFELTVNTMPFPKSAAPVIFVLPVVYTCVTWIRVAASGAQWPYDFLRWNSVWTMFWYFIFLFAHLCIFSVLNWVYLKRLDSNQVFSKKYKLIKN